IQSTHIQGAVGVSRVLRLLSAEQSLQNASFRIGDRTYTAAELGRIERERGRVAFTEFLAHHHLSVRGLGELLDDIANSSPPANAVYDLRAGSRLSTTYLLNFSLDTRDLIRRPPGAEPSAAPRGLAVPAAAQPLLGARSPEVRSQALQMLPLLEPSEQSRLTALFAQPPANATIREFQALSPAGQ